MMRLAVYDCMLFFMQAARPDRVRQVFQLVDGGSVKYCLSPAVIAEISDVLTRPKHRRLFPNLTPKHVEAFVEEIVRASLFVTDIHDVYELKRDPKDSKYVNLAIAAKASFIVTRDRDLLELMDGSSTEGRSFQDRFPSLRIITPAVFYAEIGTR